MTARPPLASPRRLALALALLLPLPAAGAETPAAERWRPVPACPRDQVAPGRYNRCLYDTIRASEAALEAALADALAAIEARADLAPVQRVRWKLLLDEAQSRFLIFRNFDCQSVAPFEGRRGIGNFEQRALCLIELNLTRAADLKARYPMPAAAAAGPAGPAARPGTWTFPLHPPVD